MLRSKRTTDALKELFDLSIELGWSWQQTVEFYGKYPNTPALLKALKKLKDERT